ncbi:aminotransferase class III-fold pyridoxal phosphate-dependent enzyme [Actinosynnema pretiosum subsp. pretiosum]|uniref:Aminotransferase class-III n=2 Tax=Actinosynnema TaxID=40566 RepID=C6WN12_ACTMD|nr:aminotransferase class III-fold pyridoxal phosphate-dependent enzyme [Actinosynnema mirum]ACU38525.1 aminotransferase class-III [Actinosynnema mirum DSM 43827]QUF03912.1 aminotransferase class III-fold pyridoxal phosphate-dependent enzyme [Actinosynnema pretiosum subsp. pretiosum]
MGTAEVELAEPTMLGWLSDYGLDVEYVRSSGNTLFAKQADGSEKPVLDFAGGYGSVLLGHNNPELVELARELLADGTPIHAQFSRHPYANRLANELNAVLHREFGVSEPYYAVFANSGAEAVEAAVKHAELDRGHRVRAVVEAVGSAVAAARAAVDGGALVDEEAYREFGVASGDFGALADRLVALAGEAASRRPVFLALEGGFHGKLVGSTQLTHNPGYREPFSALARPTRFVALNRPESVREVLEPERVWLREPVVVDGVVRLTDRELPVVTAFLLEPVQGEGGIREVEAEFAKEIGAACEEAGVPVVVDEVQSGMGRCGAFFASSQIGLRGDYYALSKSLGGGIAKAAVMLVRGKHYRGDFELVHSSTFAKDSFSCTVALRALALMEADGGRAYRVAAERGQRLAGVLESIRADHPDLVLEVRGRGLMLGLELRDQSGSANAAVAGQAAAGMLGYAVAGYLLREHAIRLFPTASATSTLRFEPSLHVSDEEIARLENGLRDVMAVLGDPVRGLV